jgi:hypothetical protein
MALTVAPLGGFPAINTYYQSSTGGKSSGTGPTITENPAHGSYTSGVYTQSGTQYVAGILDQQGVNPSRIFFSDNGQGSGSTGATVVLPTLVSVTQVSAHGQSLQELASNYSSSVSFNEYADMVGYAGFQIILNAAVASADDGVYPLGFDNAVNNSGSANYANTPGWVSQGGAYTGTTTVGYPNPQMRFFVTLNAMLILASTSTG